MPNEKNLTPELLEKAKSATSAATLLTLAQENGISLTAEEAANYYSQLHPKIGAISDEELDNVSGGCGEKTTKELALKYMKRTYCDQFPECLAIRANNMGEKNFYLNIPKLQGKICYGCPYKGLIDRLCSSEGWEILESASPM